MTFNIRKKSNLLDGYRGLKWLLPIFRIIRPESIPRETKITLEIQLTGEISFMSLQSDDVQSELLEEKRLVVKKLLASLEDLISMEDMLNAPARGYRIQNIEATV